MIIDGSFEIPTDSGLFALTGWKTTLTGTPTSEFGTLETVTATDAPHGDSYIKLRDVLGSWLVLFEPKIPMIPI